MGDDALRPAPGRSGCLKWSCGCLAVAALLSLIVLITGWYALSGWTPAGTAWENLPPDTAFAIEIHDAESLLETIAADPGALSLANALLRAYRVLHGGRGVPAKEYLPGTAYEYLKSLSWLYTTFFPNYILFGALASSAGEAFLIVQPPRWFAWTAGAAAEEGAVEEISDGRGTVVFIAFVGRHVVLGLTPDIVRHVVDNWKAASAPLGKDAGCDSPYVMVAARGGEDIPRVPDAAPGEAAGAEPGGGGGAPFLSGGLADNFAPPAPFAPPAGEAPAPARAASRFQAIATAGENGWNIAFASSADAAPFPPAGFAGRGGGGGADSPAVVLPDASDLELALRLPKAALERLKDRAAGALPPRFGGDWLTRGWLDGAGGMFTVLASRPPAAAGEAGQPPYPPLPLLRLGWDCDSPHAPESFAQCLGEGLDALRASGGPLPQSIMQALVAYETAPDGLSGVVSVPPVFANGACPAWKFLPGASLSTGWMATDPSGLPDESLVRRLAVFGLPEFVGGHASAAVNWDMSRVFIDAVEAFAADRLSQLPDEWFAGFRGGSGDIVRAVHFIGRLFAAYPRGAVKADIDTVTHEMTGRAFVPFGMSVEIE